MTSPFRDCSAYSGPRGTVQASQSSPIPSTDDSGGGTAVHDESWYLGDGGFAARHLEDEERMAAKEVSERV